MAQLTCQKLCIGYDGRPVLQDLDFEVFAGDYLCIVGENGSGKSMRLIAERLRSEARNGRTILVITHDRELIESCCDTVVEVEKRSS